MPDADQAAEEQSAMLQRLRALVDDAAMRSVLGKLSRADFLAFVETIRKEARAAGLLDLAAVAANSLRTVRKAAKTKVGALFSTEIARIQNALMAPPALRPPEPAATAPSSSSFTALSGDRELLADFILESREHLAQVEVQMIVLEKEPGDAEAINTVFRAFHTVKGLAGFLDLNDIRDVAHETETLLDLARNRRLAILPEVVDVVLAAADFLKDWLARVEKSLAGSDPGPAPAKSELVERLRRAATGAPDSAPPSPQPSPGVEARGEDRRRASSENWAGPERRSGEDRRTSAAEAHAVKVDTAKLDFLVDMAGEMVIAQSMLRHHPELAELHSPAVLHSLAQLERITGDLQKTAMSMRMVPIGGLFQKMIRLVRDLARKVGKQAELEAIGGDTELDRNVVEELSDPLMHMVRNAIDHGLASAEERIAAGKDPTGRIRLKAWHQAGHIVIEVADDGRGLDRGRILEKARRMGLLEDGAALSDAEIFNLIFHPGFSTVDQVTEVSGRGVGMDVVRRQIQKLRGRVDIQSVPGRGTSFLLRLPLTLAMIDGLVVGVGCERFVVPIFSVREMLRPSADTVFTVEGRQEMALVRNNLMPIVRLHRRFAIPPRSENPVESLLIVAEAAGKTFCLMVDDLIGKQEVVIKSLGETLKDIPGVAGGAILGDGRVGLILDLEGIFREAHP